LPSQIPKVSKVGSKIGSEEEEVEEVPIVNSIIAETQAVDIPTQVEKKELQPEPLKDLVTPNVTEHAEEKSRFLLITQPFWVINPLSIAMEVIDQGVYIEDKSVHS
jgi:hypothetical protein